MAKIVNTRNNGDPAVLTGEVMVNSKNVYPATVVAAPTATTTITLALLKAYEFFVGAQTSAATDKIALPASAPVGTEIVIFATNSFGVIKETGSSDTINGVGTIVTIAANASARILKVSATAWQLTHVASNGALTAPVV